MWIFSVCCKCFVLHLIFNGFTTMNKINHSEFSTFIIQKDMKYATIMFIISLLAPLCSQGDMGWDIAQRESTHSHLFHCHDQGKKQLTKSIIIFQGFLKYVEAVVSLLTVGTNNLLWVIFIHICHNLTHGKYNYLNHRKWIIIAQSASHIKQTWSQSGVEKVLCQNSRGGAVLNLFALTFWAEVIQTGVHVSEWTNPGGSCNLMLVCLRKLAVLQLLHQLER